MQQGVDLSFIIGPETGINDDQGFDGGDWPRTERPLWNTRVKQADVFLDNGPKRPYSAIFLAC